MKPIQYSKKLQAIADKKDFTAIRKIAKKCFSEDENLLFSEDPENGRLPEDFKDDLEFGFENGVNLAYKLAAKNLILFKVYDVDADEDVAYIAAKNLAEAIAKVEKLPNRE